MSRQLSSTKEQLLLVSGLLEIHSCNKKTSQIKLTRQHLLKKEICLCKKNNCRINIKLLNYGSCTLLSLIMRPFNKFSLPISIRLSINF